MQTAAHRKRFFTWRILHPAEGGERHDGEIKAEYIGGDVVSTNWVNSRRHEYHKRRNASSL